MDTTNQPLGTPLLSSPQPSVPQQQPSGGYASMPPVPPVTPEPPQGKGGHGKLWLIIVFCVLLIAGLGAGAYFLFFKEKPLPVYADFDADDNEEEFDADEDEVAAVADVDVEDEPAAPAATPVSPDEPRLLNLEGDADGYPLSLRLTIQPNGRVEGDYKNEQQGTIVRVSGTYSGGAMQLSGRLGRTTYTFRVRPDGHIYTGSFTTSTGKNLELHLVER